MIAENFADPDEEYKASPETMRKVRLFLSCVVDGVPVENEVERYIRNDNWIEFQTSELAQFLDEYHTLLEFSEKAKKVLDDSGL